MELLELSLCGRNALIANRLGLECLANVRGILPLLQRDRGTRNTVLHGDPRAIRSRVPTATSRPPTGNTVLRPQSTTATCSDGTVFSAAKRLANKLARPRRYRRRPPRRIRALTQAQGLEHGNHCPRETRLQVPNRRRRTQQLIGRLYAQFGDIRRDHLL